MLAVAEAGRAAGCHEALFTLGDKPELRYRAAREELDRLGFPTTAAYLAHCAGLVLRETGLLPHANPGILDDDELLALREVSRLAGDHARDRERAAVAARRGRTSARPTSCPRCASTRSTAPGASRSRTRAAS